MSSKNRVPLEINAEWHRADDSILLTSEDPLLPGWKATVPAGSEAWSALRSKLVPKPVKGSRNALGMVEAFLESGAADLSFPSGIRVSTNPFPELSRVIPLTSFPDSGVYVGLSTRGARVLSVSDASGPSPTAFVQSLLPGEETTYMDFATLDLATLSPSHRREYGTLVTLSFLRSPHLRYMVVENFTPVKGGARNVHPGIRYDMLSQIHDQLPLFADTGRMLILAGTSTLIKPDLSILLDSEAGTFTVGGLVFDWEPVV